jgi:hypothetical protein
MTFGHSGGYDYEFADPVPEKYLCAICYKVLRDARLTACCGQHFCGRCLTKWLATNGMEKCPLCREVNLVSMLNKEKVREINELRVRCTKKRKGCVWVGALSDIGKHLKSDNGCGYVLVKCDRGGYLYYKKRSVVCSVKVKRRYFAKHLESECLFRQYTCEHCNYVDTYDAIAGSGQVRNQNSTVGSSVNHYDVCEHYPLKCPRKCGAKIKRKDLESHQDNCPLETLSCPFKCGQEKLRKDMEYHKNSSCILRPYHCIHCGTLGTYVSITGEGNCESGCHYDKCENYPLDCVNSCEKKRIMRKDMEDHRKTCPEEPIRCKLCSITYLRKDLKTHNSTKCDIRPYQCEHCGHVGTYASITGKGHVSLLGCYSHYEMCEQYPLDHRCVTCDAKVKRVEKHMCPLDQVKCPFGGEVCAFELQGYIRRKDIQNHKKECKYRPYTCEYCGFTDTYKAITGIGIFCIRSWPRHYDKCKKLFNCPFKYAGCTHRIQQNEIHAHCQTNVHAHLKMVSLSHKQLIVKNEKMVQKNEEFLRKSDKMAKKVEEMGHKYEMMARANESAIDGLLKRIDKLEQH